MRFLVRVVAVVLLTNVRVQLFAERLDRSPVLAACVQDVLREASVLANNSWQYISAGNIGRTNFFCTLNVSAATQDNSLDASVNAMPLFPMPRLLLRIDHLQFQRGMLDASECSATSRVYLNRVQAWSDYLCSSATERYIWIDDWLIFTIYNRTERPILQFEATFAVLSTANVCQAGMNSNATLFVDKVAYAYAPDAWYAKLLKSNSKCEGIGNYTLRVRAANASLLLRMTLLTAPDDAACRRLCVEDRCFVASDVGVSVEATQHATIVYTSLQRCAALVHTGFTLKLESALPPALHSNQSGGVLSEVGTIALVVSLILVVLIVAILIIAVITFRIRRLRQTERVCSLAKQSGNAAQNRRSNECSSISLSCADGIGLATAATVSAESEVAMVDNELYV